MPRMIAIPKNKEARNFASLGVGQRRASLLRLATDKSQIEPMLDLGFVQVGAGVSGRSKSKRRNGPGQFAQLQNLGFLLVDADDRITDRTRSELHSSYIMVPDIKLELPRTKLDQPTVGIPKRWKGWPEESGVKLAKKQDVAGEGVLIGVVDTGLDADHAEFRGRDIDFRYVPLDRDPTHVRDVRGFDVDGHGTHVCGIIAGKNVGIAPRAKLFVASVIESETVTTSLERILLGLDWIVSHFQDDDNKEKPTIVSMSLGFLPEMLSANEATAAVVGISELLELMTEFDTLPIVAIGNDGAGTIRAPGYFSDVLSVGAVDGKLRPATFSGSGISPTTGTREPDMVGFGVDILSSLERDKGNQSLYAKSSGTSMATPYVAGIAALYAERDGIAGKALKVKVEGTAMALAADSNRVGLGLARYQ